LPDAVPPPAGGAGIVLTGVGFGSGFAVGFALADLLGVGVTDALVGPPVGVGGAVLDDVALDEPALEAVALEAAAPERAALDAGLEAAGPADEAAPLVLATALDGVPSGAA
jgi:hypothetical protein